jgi:uncharacterized protein
MPITVNLRHLEEHDVKLEGELPVEELDIDSRDEVVQATHPLTYHLEVQRLEDSLLVQGKLRLMLDCECVRCLKPIAYPLELPNWTCHLPLEGEDAVPILNDTVDLTPLAREDILLEFPQHPLCEPECRGLPEAAHGQLRKANNADQTESHLSAWSELNKLKF